MLKLISLLYLASTAPLETGDLCTGEECAVSEVSEQEVFIALLQEKHCLQTELPVVSVDEIQIITDEEGRVYYSGSNPIPFQIQVSWCGYDLDLDADLEVVVARKRPSTWGWDFKLKFAGSMLMLDAVERDLEKSVDVGLLWEFFHWRDFNLNVATGFRSVGANVGYDLTENFGTFGGYAFSFWSLRSNPQVGLYFDFW